MLVNENIFLIQIFFFLITLLFCTILETEPRLYLILY